MGEMVGLFVNELDPSDYKLTFLIPFSMNKMAPFRPIPG